MQRTSDVLGVILVHGLWHGGWVWDAVRRDLDRAGVVSRVVELPMTDLASDITVTRRALDEFDRPAVLVGHSYGGAVTTGAGTHPQVAHLLYLAAFQLAEGESVGSTLPDLGVPPTRLGDAFRFSDDGEVVTLDPGLAEAASCTTLATSHLLVALGPSLAACRSVSLLSLIHI